MLVLCLVWTSEAAAADKPATCATLQATLDNAADGDTIILDSSAGPGGLCNASYTLKSFTPSTNLAIWVLQGKTDQDGFDGSGLEDRVLTGTDVERLEIRNLVFQDSSSSTNGGAIEVTGNSQLIVRTSEFFNNHAAGKGGAVHVFGEQLEAVNGFFFFSDNVFGSESNPALGNTAGESGGAVSVESRQTNGNSGLGNNLFANNVAVLDGGGFDVVVLPDGSQNVSLSSNDVLSNRAGGSGGGGHLKVKHSSLVRLDQELYQGNSLVPLVADVQAAQVGEGHYGGGIYIETGSSQIIQRDNLFRDNTVNQFSPSAGMGGGGEAIDASDAAPEVPHFTRSQFDVFEGNTVAAPPADSVFESEGAGLWFIGSTSTFHGWVDVFAANQIVDSGEGGGAYAGGDEVNLELWDSTVAGNSVGPNGSNAGLGGGGGGVLLQLRNSIVYNSPLPDIGGFAGYDVLYSDACDPEGGAFPGTGNICADPLLADPAAGDIHQTKPSPTIDKGNDDLFFEQAGEGPFEDFEGDDRPTDGDGDGNTADMGADETPADFIKPAPPPPPTPTSPAKAAQCSDGVDNDSDGAIDAQDPGCLSGVNSIFNPADANEADEGLGDLVLCGRRNISLVRADARGRTVALNGLVAARFAGQKVALFANYGSGWKKLATKKSSAAGAFKAQVPGPPARLFNKVRYQARIGKFRSVALKLPQSLASSSVRQQGGDIVLKGKVKRSLLGKRNAVIIRRLVCGHYQKVGQAKPDRRGNYTVRFKAPALAAAALYRAETNVLARPGSKRYVKQYARAVGITLSGQTG